jgi:hypothetical protein
MSRRARGTLLLAAWLALGPVLPAAAQAPAAPNASAPGAATREQVERRLQSTGALLGNSSGARQVQASGNADATAQLDKARSLHAQARVQLDAGDLEAANKLLHAAARTMMEAVSLAAPEQITAGKDRADFNNRLESTRALLDAQRRIAAEKGSGTRNADVVKRIEAMMAEAQSLAAAGKVADGRKLLDQAYGASRAAIGNLRGGDTLVRSLSFANKEEEYRYEIDRNDTHRMLVTVLLQDRRGGGMDALIERAMAESLRLRQQAEAQAAARDHEGAVKTLEDSTRELVKAIRGAGVYIPG